MNTTLEGLEGFKILSESTSTIPNVWSTVLIVLILACFALAVWCITYACINGSFIALVSSFVFAVVAICVIAIVDKPGEKYKVYKITAIQDKYYIDLNKYKITNNEDNIITIEEIINK